MFNWIKKVFKKSEKEESIRIQLDVNIVHSGSINLGGINARLDKEAPQPGLSENTSPVGDSERVLDPVLPEVEMFADIDTPEVNFGNED